jgi:4,5-DOPA dioxygenase extradiol
MPVVFISHGAPDALLKADDAVACWREIGSTLQKPKAILAISAHWEAPQATLSLADSPATIYDFSGFSPELYKLNYPAVGAPALAQRTQFLLANTGIATQLHPNRGLDHGAWVPLSAMFPDADVPVTQLSLILHQNAAAHFQLGQALLPLREEGVLILCSGAITHNFSWLNWHNPAHSSPLAKATQFTDWVAEQLIANDPTGLLNYRSAPSGAEAHPTEEHFLPLLVALGAAAGAIPTRFRPNFTYGNLAMDAYVWK